MTIVLPFCMICLLLALGKMLRVKVRLFLKSLHSCLGFGWNFRVDFNSGFKFAAGVWR